MNVYIYIHTHVFIYICICLNTILELCFFENISVCIFGEATHVATAAAVRTAHSSLSSDDRSAMVHYEPRTCWAQKSALAAANSGGIVHGYIVCIWNNNVKLGLRSPPINNSRPSADFEAICKLGNMLFPKKWAQCNP